MKKFNLLMMILAASLGSFAQDVATTAAEEAKAVIPEPSLGVKLYRIVDYHAFDIFDYSVVCGHHFV
ncbi:hypothetical protein [Pedobacter sp. SL55]|uniref:hypothetical protein n=1 Tax=Pedobacter sp. SL55 TaxID=2995161 RepID=UPI0022718ACA|nr:hypothetical protein [Pedobacter sp. SL55]WAC39904.1 hypothetical protein OVA16_15140 [Pedobacter sp. SL55]